MRIPDPIANTTTEAYLAYKAGVLSEGELKPKLYDPYIHLDAWLAYWAGLTTTYPVKNVGKNLFDIAKVNHLALSGTIVEDASYRGYTLKVFPGETYTISRASTSAPNRFRYCFTKVVPAAGGAYYGLQQIDSQIKDTFTVPDEMNYLLVYLSNLNDTITESMGIQIEEGSTATAYEPYTGEPEMLTDEEALIAYLSGVTNTYPEEFRDPADVRVAAYLKYLVSARFGRPEYPVTNEELYLSMMDAPYIPAGEPSSDIEIDDTAEAPFKDVKMYGDTSQNGTPTPSTPIAVNTTTGENVVKISDGQGNEQSYEVNLGKNLLAPTITGSRTNQGATVAYAGDKITLNGPSGGYLGYRADTTTLPMTIKQGQSFALTMKYKSGTINTGGTYSYRFGVYGVKADNSTERFIDLYLPYDTATPSGSIVGTATSDYIGIALGCYISSATNTTTGDVIFDVQLERGTEATDYAAYFEPIELCKIGTYQDYIYENDGKWYVHKAIGKYVYNNDLGQNGYDTHHIAMLTPEVGVIPNLEFSDSRFYCNMLKAPLVDYTGIKGTTSIGRIRVEFNTSVAADYTAVRELAAKNNLCIYFLLNEATDTEITNTALVAQLEALKAGGSYTGTTYIKVSATDPNLPGLLEVEAYKYD